ncbi:MAG: HYR domain-containing protein [Thaumarchaeota archaeon]|nr:HYR domain-containing protein [Nitrososphaerota archaeon]
MSMDIDYQKLELALILVGILTTLVFTATTISVMAEEPIQIIIPSGTGTPGCEKTNSCYLPYVASVGVDQTVIWVNEDSAAHTVTSGVSGYFGEEEPLGPDGKFDSNLFLPGQTFSVIFGGEGIYDYFCIVHPWMRGVVIVDENYGSQTTPITITLHTDKSVYSYGDTIHVSGTVSEIIGGFPVTYQVIRPDSEIISLGQLDVSTNRTFQTELTAGGPMWDTNGIYTIKVLYGTEDSNAQTTIEFKKKTEPDLVPPLLLIPEDILVVATDNQGARVEYSVKSIDDVDGVLEPFCNPPSRHLFPIGDNVVTCQSFDSSGNNIKKSFIITVQNPPTFVIPDWVKDVAGFWCDGEIDDPSFIEAIQYLIENRVILVPISESGSGTSQIVPSWIKNNACWWSQGLISDDDFASGIEYLINQGIIIV